MTADRRRKMRLFPFAAWCALAGGVVPVFLGAAWWLINTASNHNLSFEILMEKVTLVLWPSSLPLVAGAGFDNGSMTRTLFLAGIALNAMLYGLVGASVWLGIRKHRALLVLPVVGVGGLWAWLLTL